jgi:hypothetical protein
MGKVVAYTVRWAMQIERHGIRAARHRLRVLGDMVIPGSRIGAEGLIGLSALARFCMRLGMVFAKSASLPATLDRLISTVGALRAWLVDQDLLRLNSEFDSSPLDKKGCKYKDLVQGVVIGLTVVPVYLSVGCCRISAC